MEQLCRFSRKRLLLLCTLTACIFFIAMTPDYYNRYYESNIPEIPDPKPPVCDTRHKYTYIDLQNLNYSKQSAPPCDTQSPYLLILVHSSPPDFIHRLTIRKTWGSIQKIFGHYIRVVFFVGEVGGTVEWMVDREMEVHQDIVKGNFADSYRNLTYKHILAYKWFLSNCERVSVAMKVDDDVFVDVFRTVRVLTKTFGFHPVNLLGGKLERFVDVLREGKWTVSREEYPFNIYPEYFKGYAYFVSADVARRMYSVVETMPFFWIDDVFMTGFVADAARVIKTDLGSRVSVRDNFLIKWLLGNSTEPSQWMACHVQRHLWPQIILKLWSKTLKAWNISSVF